MSQPSSRPLSWRRLPWVLAVLVCMIAMPAGAQDSGASATRGMFRDVPPGHWAFEAVEKLAAEGLMEGFPDGTFKGKKVVTRYDLAVIVAKILDRVGQVRAAGGTLTPEETLTVSRLTNEFRAELDLLGVRVSSLERRFDAVEQKVERLDATLSNVRLEGFYRLENTFVARPFDFTNYPFNREVNPFRQFRDVGLEPLGQEAFLRFIGQPFLGGGFFRDLEAFLEMRARISGPTRGNSRLVYRFSDPPIAGDPIDDFATGIEDEQRVNVNKAHLVIRAKRLTTRAFSNESMTDHTDPSVLLTIDSFDAFSGLEGGGAYKKLSYNTSVLKAFDLEEVSDGNNPLDLTDVFKPIEPDEDDVYAMRILYEPYRKRDGSSHPNKLVFGGSYVERALDYTTFENFNRVIAGDIQGGRTTDRYNWDVTFQGMRSDGDEDVDGSAFKADGAYQLGDLTFSAKGYRFGKDFRAEVAAFQWTDTSLFPYRDNFARRSPTERGERLLRLEGRYDFRDRLGRIFEDFNLSLLWETKHWEDPLVTDGVRGQPGTRARVQTLVDFTDRTHMEFAFEHQEDNLPAETGLNFGNLSMDVKVTDDTSAVGNLEFIDDFDAVGPDGKHYAQRLGRFRLNTQLNRKLFLSGFAEYINNALLRSFSRTDPTVLFEDDEGNIIRPLATNIRGSVLRPQRNGLDLSSIGGEANYRFSDEVSLRLFLHREDAEDDIDTGLDGTTELAVGEVNWQLTRSLKARYIHSLMNIDLVRRNDDYVVNNFFELLYEPTTKTEMRLTYGYEYENPDDRFDDGPLLFYRRNKIVQLRAQTDF